jgi:hypothetical protein
MATWLPIVVPIVASAVGGILGGITKRAIGGSSKSKRSLEQPQYIYYNDPYYSTYPTTVASTSYGYNSIPSTYNSGYQTTMTTLYG